MIGCEHCANCLFLHSNLELKISEKKVKCSVQSGHGVDGGPEAADGAEEGGGARQEEEEQSPVLHSADWPH